MAIMIVVVLVAFFDGDEETSASGTTFVVKRGNLPITVVAGGAAESLEPNHFKCEVKSRTKILEIVEEGYRVTKEDIENKKVLVELDPSELEDRIRDQETQYQQAKANYAKAEQDYEIQEEENESDIKTAERQVKFKGMDLQKYLGDVLANQLMAELAKRRAIEKAGEEAKDKAALAKEAERMAEEKKSAFEAAKAEQQRKVAGAENDSEKDKEAVKESEHEDKPKDGKKEERAQAQIGRDEADSADASKQQEAMKVAIAKAAEGDSPEAIMKAMAEQGQPEAEINLDELEKAAADAAKAAKETAEAATAAAEAFQETVRPAGLPLPNSVDGAPVFEVEFEPFAFARLADDKRLKGEAEQKKISLESDILLARNDLSTAQKELTGTENLRANDFVTEMELEQKRMNVTRCTLGLEAKRRSQELFFRYEFPKQAEEAFAQYEEALRKLDQVKKLTVTKLESSRVNRDSNKSRFEAQEKERKELQEQLASCKIYATHEGLVVYGDGVNRWWRGDPIAKGTEVHYQRAILTIPDITQMCIKVTIHESVVQKIEKGQKATVTVEARPDEKIRGEVSKVGVLPSTENRWLNPDLKVYSATITIDGVYDWLKPGMTAEVEIDVDELEEILYVPLQAVSSRGDDRICYLASEEPRVVETGQFSDKYIEIKKGLEENDEILLRPLESDEEQQEKEDEELDRDEHEKDGTDKKDNEEEKETTEESEPEHSEAA
ncbi:MAG TPA: HlyD family efflux transporter periplasmic adaptor subunit [Candidatus Hydrogenedentes bacterium]|nr:HlyD family efflux transporter periplasmic adaptor subunit [Candidatus Hydrogenedentota bacterium]